MAKISTNTEETVYRISEWLGVNECPDGDTEIKPGEAAELKNFRITADGNLRPRPGFTFVRPNDVGWAAYKIRGVWSGFVGGEEVMVFVYGNRIYKFGEKESVSVMGYRSGGSGQEVLLDNENEVFFFGYNDKLYAMDGEQFLVWDGSIPTLTGSVRLGGFLPIDGTGEDQTYNQAYIPLVAVSIPPGADGGGTELEGINRLSLYRRVWLSPTGATSEVFKLPETDIASAVLYNRETGVEAGIFTSGAFEDGVVEIGSLNKGTNNYEMVYKVNDNSMYASVCAMRFAETYNGTQDARVFIYGNGTNQVFYSGLDYNGQPRADYYPVLNVLNVGTANTPVTGLIRHFSRLLAFKPDSTHSIQYSTLTLEDGRSVAAFYANTVNKTIGNEAPGQVQLVENNPFSICHESVYQWRNTSSYSSNLSIDERQAKRVSDRVQKTLKTLDFSKIHTFDDSIRKEYYILIADEWSGLSSAPNDERYGIAIVYNYAKDVWYIYEDFPVRQMCLYKKKLYGTTGFGGIVEINYDYEKDTLTDGTVENIDCLWRSGSLAFGRPWQRKYSAQIFVSVMPQEGKGADISIRTDRKTAYMTRQIAFPYNEAAPKVKRVKLKAKKFAYYQLAFTSPADESLTPATILESDIRLRYTGTVK